MDSQEQQPDKKRMNPEVKTKWLAALRSGNYKQGRMALKRGVGDGTADYCCLGVLCDISGLGAWEIGRAHV